LQKKRKIPSSSTTLWQYFHLPPPSLMLQYIFGQVSGIKPSQTAFGPDVCRGGGGADIAQKMQHTSTFALFLMHLPPLSVFLSSTLCLLLLSSLSSSYLTCVFFVLFRSGFYCSMTMQGFFSDPRNAARALCDFLRKDVDLWSLERGECVKVRGASFTGSSGCVRCSTRMRQP
jgi:hypothetical protein